MPERRLSIEIFPRPEWATGIATDLAAMEPALRERWRGLFAHVDDVGPGEPGPRWTSRTRQRLDDLGREEFAGRTAGWIVAAAMDHASIAPPLTTFLRGLIWTASDVRDPTLVRAIAQLGVSCNGPARGQGVRSRQVGRACSEALARLGGEEAIAQLAWMARKAPRPAGRGHAEDALRRAAGALGKRPEQVVADHGLTEVGLREDRFGDHVSRIRFGSDGDLRWEWSRADGRVVKSVPAAVSRGHRPPLEALRADFKDLKRQLPIQRHRLERSWLTGESWDIEAWRREILDHAVVGAFARALFWEVESRLVGWADGRLVDPVDGSTAESRAGARVRLWHPLGARPETLDACRRWLAERGVAQAFPQVERRTFRSTPTERAGTSCERFWGTCVHHMAFLRAAAERHWTYEPIVYRARYESWATLSVSAAGLQARLLAEPGAFDYDIFDGVPVRVFLDRLEFHAGVRRLGIGDVPDLVFSEVLLSIETVLGSCTIGLGCRGTESPGARRREWLRAALPGLPRSSGATLEERALLIRGDHAVYRIHLGNGDVFLMEPRRQITSIDHRLDHADRPDDLPEGEEVLEAIVGKALALLRDDSCWLRAESRLELD